MNVLFYDWYHILYRIYAEILSQYKSRSDPSLRLFNRAMAIHSASVLPPPHKKILEWDRNPTGPKVPSSLRKAYPGQA